MSLDGEQKSHKIETTSTIAYAVSLFLVNKNKKNEENGSSIFFFAIIANSVQLTRSNFKLGPNFSTFTYLFVVKNQCEV
jgi:Na+/phosphate symporter